MPQRNQIDNQETADNSGNYHIEIYHGLCKEEGPDGYIPMLREMMPAQENCLDGSLEFHGCDASFASVTTTTMGSGYQLDVSVTSPEQCEVFTAEPNNAGAIIPFVGTAEISGTGPADTSMVFVIGRSESSCNANNLGCSSDANYDLQFDDILDCEISAILDLVQKVREEGIVREIGIVGLTRKLGNMLSATVELPLIDINIFDQGIAKAIDNSLRYIDCGGVANYAVAVEKACEVMENSKTTRNAVVFISDGLPANGGAPSAYCSNNVVFHTVALGGAIDCTAGEDTSLLAIAEATQGTCQNVQSVADISPTLRDITNVQFRSIQASSVASPTSVNFGCEDVPNFVNNVGMNCLYMASFCGGEYASTKHQNILGQTGDSSCCVCGGGVYLDIGNLDQYAADTIIPRENSHMVTSFTDTAVMHPGAHKVCTTVISTDAGVPSANVQCRNILVCNNPGDF